MPPSGAPDNRAVLRSGGVSAPRSYRWESPRRRPAANLEATPATARDHCIRREELPRHGERADSAPLPARAGVRLAGTAAARVEA